MRLGQRRVCIAVRLGSRLLGKVLGESAARKLGMGMWEEVSLRDGTVSRLCTPGYLWLQPETKLRSMLIARWCTRAGHAEQAPPHSFPKLGHAIHRRHDFIELSSLSNRDDRLLYNDRLTHESTTTPSRPKSFSSSNIPGRSSAAHLHAKLKRHRPPCCLIAL